MNRKWHYRFIDLARLVATWSKDTTQVGAVIANDNKVISIGYNGFPKGVEDSSCRLCDRAVKYAMVLHAEINAILMAKQDLTGCAIYTTLCPCSNCASTIIQVGITNVYTIEPTGELKERWKDSNTIALKMLEEAHVDIEFL